MCYACGEASCRRVRVNLSGRGEGEVEEEEEEEESDEEEEDEDTTLEEAKASLCEALDTIKGIGKFAHFGTFAEWADPMLSVDDSGPIKLPLNDTDAQRIIAASHQAPFGRGTETIIDTSVRRTWEINFDRVKIANPHWNSIVWAALQGTYAGLGLGSEQGVQAVPYKLLLYERGALFKPHKDTEKVPGMFGTLVINLPSPHTGGLLRLSHAGATTAFDTGRWQYSFAAWYSDVTHEVEEVTSGYRLVMTYNLVRKSSQTPISATTLGQQLHEPTVKAVKDWSLACDNEGCYDPAIYMLEHKYTEASISFDTLKGADDARAQVLQNVAHQTGMVIFLANMERMQSGPPVYDERYDWAEDEYDSDGNSPEPAEGYREIDEVHESELKLKRIIHVSGAVVADEIDVEEGYIIQREPFEDRAPDDHNYTGNTGNAGAEETHWYRDMVLVMVESYHAMSFILRAHKNQSGQGRKDIAPLLDGCIHKVRSQPHVQQYKMDLLDLCNYIITVNHTTLNKDTRYRSTNSLYPDSVVSKVVESLVSLGHTTGLQRAVASVSGKLPVTAFQAMGTLLGSGQFAIVQPALDCALTKNTTLYEKARVLEALFGGDLGNRRGAAAGWAENILLKATKEIKQVTEDDGEALADVAVCLRDEELLRTLIMPTVMANTGQTLFAIAFLSCWGVNAETAFPQPTFRSILQQVWTPMLAEFQIGTPRPLPPGVARSRGQQGAAKSALRVSSGTARNFILLLVILHKQGLPDELYDLVTSISQRHVPTAKGEVMLSVWVPVLQQIQALALATLDNMFGDIFATLYKGVLGAFIVKYVEPQPGPHRGWARQILDCGCRRTCWQVNVFLTSATQQVGRFTAEKEERHHLHVQLDGIRFDGTHVTKRTRGEPQTLVVTKRDRAKEKYDAWVARCRRAYDEIQKFDQYGLRRLLGDELYEDTVEMRSVCLYARDAPELQFLRRRQPLGEVQNPPAAAAPPAAAVRAGMKRKAGVIDLSGDSD